MKSTIEKLENHVYYNFIYTNTSDRREAIQLIDNRTMAFIERPSDWQVSLIRFQIDLSYVPIMLWPNTSESVFSPDNNYFSVTIDNGVEVKQTFLIAPDEGFPEHDYTTQLFSFQSIVDSLNQAFVTCCASFAAPIARAPYAVFDSETSLINIVVPTPTFNTFKIFMNQNLFLLFQNFQTQPNTDPSTLGRDQRLKFAVLGNNQITATTPPAGSGVSGTGLYIFAQFANLGQMFDIRRIVFTSSLLPVRSDLIPNSFANTNNTQSSNTAKILTDFEISLEGKNAQTIRGIQEYNVNGEYRLLDLIGDKPLQQIDLSVFWIDFKGKYHAIVLNKNSYVSAKLMFRKKNFKTYI